MITRGTAPDIYDVAFQDIYSEEWQQITGEWEPIFTLETSKKKSEKYSSLTGFGVAVEKPEGADVELDDPYQGYDKEFTHKTFGLGFQITWEAEADDQFGKMKELPRGLARSLAEKPELDTAAIFNNAFTSGTGGDANYLCASDHANESGGSTGSNVLATPADLSFTSLKTALTQMRKMTNARGIYIALKPEIVLIPPDLEFDLEQILNSTLAPGVSVNDINSVRRKYSLTPHQMTRITDPDCWFLLATQRRDLKFIWRQKPGDLLSDRYVSSRTREYNDVERYSLGWTGWRFILGTPGA